MHKLIKKALLKFFIVFSLIFFIFFFSLKFSIEHFNVKTVDCAVSKNLNEQNTNSEDYFYILEESTGNVLKILCKDFLISTLALEMEADSPEEALKAQTIAANTFFKNLREKQKIKKDKKLKGADFLVNSKSKIYYLTEGQIKEKWGKDYDKNYEKFRSLVNLVYKKTIRFKKQYIEALYHDISSGNTENNEDVFGNFCSYLVSVDSHIDKFAPDYLSEKEVNFTEFYKTIKSNYDGINFYTENPWQIITDIQKAKTGFVKKIKVLGKELTGREIRSLFKLRSSNFDIELGKNTVKFTVRGHGHGVGMSQFGAVEMAKDSKNYEEILKHYYTGVEILDD